MHRSSRAQAALEFLTTYGWAFMVILIMTGTLAYFGVLSPGKFLPNRCQFGSEFQCVDYQISGSGNSLTLKLRNNVGELIRISTVSITSEGSTPNTCAPNSPNAYPWPTVASGDAWRAGNVSDFTWNNCAWGTAGLVKGEKGKIFMSIRYYSVTSGSNFEKESKGELLTTVV